MSEMKAVPEIQKYLASCPDLWEQVVRILDLHATLTSERDTERGLRLAADQENDRLRAERDGLKADYNDLDSESDVFIESVRDALGDDALRAVVDSEIGFVPEDIVRAIVALKQQVERLSAPVSEQEWLDLCSGDDVQLADLQRHEVDRFIASRTAPAPQPTTAPKEQP